MRQQSPSEVGHRQQRPDACCGAALVDPVGRAHRTAKLQLIGLACDGDYIENDIGICDLDSSNLIDWIGRRVEGDRDSEDSAAIVNASGLGRPV